MSERCHACQQPLVEGTLAGRTVWGCANCNVFSAADGSGGYFALGDDELKALLSQRLPPPNDGSG